MPSHRGPVAARIWSRSSACMRLRVTLDLLPGKITKDLCARGFVEIGRHEVQRIRLHAARRSDSAADLGEVRLFRIDLDEEGGWSCCIERIEKCWFGFKAGAKFQQGNVIGTKKQFPFRNAKPGVGITPIVPAAEEVLLRQPHG